MPAAEWCGVRWLGKEGLGYRTLLFSKQQPVHKMIKCFSSLVIKHTHEWRCQGILTVDGYFLRKMQINTVKIVRLIRWATPLVLLIYYFINQKWWELATKLFPENLIYHETFTKGLTNKLIFKFNRNISLRQMSAYGCNNSLFKADGELNLANASYICVWVPGNVCGLVIYNID